MNRRTKILLTSVIVTGTLGISSVAYALWSDDGGVEVPPISVGAVSFAGYGQSGTTTPQYSPDGSPVTLTLPAGEILRVLDQTGVDPAPVIWRFTIEGYALGIAGMNVSIAMGDQIGPNGIVTSLSSGIGRPGTIVSLSTLTVYPAAMNGDCSAVPDTPDDQERNIYLYDADDYVLQHPGAYTGSPAVQVWCVAMDFNHAVDGEYANEAQAIGTGEDGSSHASLDRWNAIVAYPPALDPLGAYRNRVDAVGTAADGTVSRAHDVYEAMIYPDPGDEPDVTIILAPQVTNLNPEFPPT